MLTQLRTACDSGRLVYSKNREDQTPAYLSPSHDTRRTDQKTLSKVLEGQCFLKFEILPVVSSHHGREVLECPTTRSARSNLGPTLGPHRSVTLPRHTPHPPACRQSRPPDESSTGNPVHYRRTRFRDCSETTQDDTVPVSTPLPGLHETRQRSARGVFSGRVGRPTSLAPTSDPSRVTTVKKLGCLTKNPWGTGGRNQTGGPRPTSAETVPRPVQELLSPQRQVQCLDRTSVSPKESRRLTHRPHTGPRRCPSNRKGTDQPLEERP